jgi:hypothetical protein
MRTGLGFRSRGVGTALRAFRGRLEEASLPLLLLLVPLLARADIPIVRDGAPIATIVLPENAVPAVRYAAEELVYHVERATGAKLEIACECDSMPDIAIYLGDTQAARAAGIKASELAPETFTLRADSKTLTLFIAGRDSAGDPLNRDTSAGTLFGVYEWLERDLGVRWLWPGGLGTFVPKTRSVMARAVAATVKPTFFQRHVRSGLEFKSAHPALGFTPAAAADYAREQTKFLRRQRLGRGEKMSYGHAFTDWWERYGKEHPEWFQLVNGKRGPAKPGARFSMCVSNPELHREIVARWKARGAPNFINVVENDILGQCECENCRAWDGPAPADAMKFYAPNFKVYGSRFVSDRYAKFALAVQQLAAKENPNVSAIGYVYFNYFQAPTSDVKLNAHILLGYCPSAGWYPRADDEHAWYQQQWKGWRDAGARLFMRTNYFLDGYNMPFVFAHQFADDFQHAARNGMVGTDFDALTGHWATQGPTLYLLMRLHTRPDAKADDLLAEYYSGFGPAAAAVKAYFDHWERYTMDNRPLIMATFEDRVAIRWRTWAKAAHRVFPESCFAPAEALLENAAHAAAGDREAAARVAFLHTGLAHAKLCARVSGLLTLADPAATPERGADALKELLRFRRAHERDWIGNFNHNAWVEELSWKLSNETKQEPEYYP